MRRWGLVIGSACAAAFFHRGIIPLLTLFFSAFGSQKTAVTPLEDSGRCLSACRPLQGDQFPGDPRCLSGHAGTFYPLIVLPRRNFTLRQTRPTSWERQRIAPRRGAPLKCGRNLRFPHKRPLPEMRRKYLFLPFCFTSRERQRIALRRSGRSQRGMRTNPSVQRRWPT